VDRKFIPELELHSETNLWFLSCGTYISPCKSWHWTSSKLDHAARKIAV